MQISVLILTHNRPELFQRCYNSVIEAKKYFDVDLEIIVNNDSNDIVEIRNEFTKYYYKQNGNLGELYKFLFEKASNEYIYYLEDDDILLENFFETFSFQHKDIIYGNYIPYKWSKEFFNFFKQTNYTDKEKFLENYNSHNFQFSQLIFRKKCLNINDFPTDNYLQNDFKIFQKLTGSFIHVSDFLYKQTRDGKDAISSEYNKDERWIS